MNTEKTETAYVDATATALVSPREGRSAHLCCGCCCDTRRATVIVNIINVVFSILTLAGIGVFTSDGFASQFDDDAVKAELAIASSNAWAAYLVACLSIVCGGLGIYGAKEYKGWMVLISGVWHCVCIILSIVTGGISSAIMSGFFAYPHFMFYQEMKKGIMTEENYPNEMHSCCCV